MKRIALLLLALAACDPKVVVDKTIARTAETVISDVTGSAVANCVVDNAQPVELEILARDVGVEAGTRTKAIIRGILARPETQKCLTRGGLVAPSLT
ncbi:hypothetical protein GC209_04025 [bacterium]|nr:hypothetical protein [bacterium]